MSAKHTPGPWVSNEKSFTVTKSNGEKIRMEMRPGGACCQTEEFNRKRLLSDSRLIASAPELLAALKDLLMVREWADETGYVQDVGFVDVEAIHDKARAAIAKAEGGR